VASNQSFSCYKGEDVVITVTLSPATNITGWGLQFTVKRGYEDGTALLTKTTAGGITITDAANGVFKITLASDDTNNATVGAGAYVFDVQRTDGGSRAVLTIGTFTVFPEVAL
jgi:hypothetical protein